MKGRRLWLVVISLIFSICMCFCLAACNSCQSCNKNDGNGTEDGTQNGNETVNPSALSVPTVSIDADGKATWNEVANASGYAFKINDGTEQTAQTREVRLADGQSIAVKAKGDGVNYADGDFSAVKTYKAPADNLSAPENLTVEIEGTDAGKVVVKWSAVEGASGYKYVINGAQQSAMTVEETTITVDLSEIDVAKLDSVWSFKVMALGDGADGIAEDGDYSDRRGSSAYCDEVEFSIADEIYTVAEITKIMNYYGENLPKREFMVAGTIAANADGDAVLENGFKLFGDDVPELYLAIDERLVGLEVTAMGTLVTDGEVRGLSSYRSVDFENIAENDRYALVIETLNAWDMLKEDSKIMDDFFIPVRLYGVNILWTVDDDDTGAFDMDKYGNVTVTCPASGAEDILVMLSAMLYIDDDHMYVDDEPTFMFAVTSDNRIQLQTPKININPKTGVATWNKIENAVRYWYNVYGVIDDDYDNWETKSVDIKGYIEAGEELSVPMQNKLWISVRAIGDGIIYRDSEVDPKQYNYYPETVEPDGTPLEFDMTKLTQTGTLANPDYIFGLACGNSDLFVSASATNVVLGNSESGGVMQGTGFIKVGSKNNDGKITLNFSKKINGVVITARQWNEDQKDKVSVNGSEEQTASKNGWGIMNFNFTASKASTKVEIDTNNRVFIQKIVVYVAD
ncbi:MAG: hypothetical protein K2N23_06480 [Clostridia bacterium]|nr:hypothetical protein [Clostridia bacterium]